MAPKGKSGSGKGGKERGPLGMIVLTRKLRAPKMVAMQ